MVVSPIPATPRYGGLLRAVVLALLLLISLSLLRSRTHRRFPSHEINYDSLLSDSSNADTTSGEDTIDALNIVKEQVPESTTGHENDEHERRKMKNVKASGERRTRLLEMMSDEHDGAAEKNSVDKSQTRIKRDGHRRKKREA